MLFRDDFFENLCFNSFFFLLATSCTKPPLQEPVEEGKTQVVTSGDVLMPSITIDLADRACNESSDCEQIPTACSCSCGEGVNKLNAAKYSESLTQMCKDYSGKMCKVRCEGQVECKNKVCTYVNK